MIKKNSIVMFDYHNKTRVVKVVDVVQAHCADGRWAKDEALITGFDLTAASKKNPLGGYRSFKPNKMKNLEVVG